jgi:hypothetical protein
MSYDAEVAERAVGSLDFIPRSGWDLGFPSGNRVAGTRSTDIRAEYELFRPIQNIPRLQRDIVEACMNAYHRIGLLRNIIDMMASFGCQGIQVVHTVKSREKVYKAWFNKVRGTERSERFLNGLYRAGNVIIKRQMAKLSASDMRDLQHSFASLEADAEYEKNKKPRNNEIPIEYVFLNPATIEMAGGDLATFLGHPIYTLKIPNFIITMIKTPKTPTQKQLVADLPDFIRKPVQAGEKFITLDNDKMSVFHYMKDDWQQWALPVTYSILADLILYEKMKLADMAALEGAISHIRIWKLGSLEHEIQVGPALHQKLHDMLLSNVGGGAMDLVWDAAIDLQETGTDVAKFLGSSKYEPVLQSIFAGLGIPASLTGGGKGAGFSNNAISLKTLIERLQYGRDLLTEFWNKELNIMQEALGDSKPARIIFDNMSLYDEAAEKMLWFQLYDRHLVDDSTMQEKFGMIPDVVAMRIKREETQRDNGNKPPKATPFHDPQTSHELTKIALQQGTVSPTETGIEKLPKKAGDKSVLDVQVEQAAKDRNLQKQQQEAQIEMDKQRLVVEKKQGGELHNQKIQHNDEKHQLDMKHKDVEHKTMLPIKKQALIKKTNIQLQNQKKGVPGQGRPKNSRDTSPRKTRTPKISSKGTDMFSIQLWAKEAQEVIAEYCNGVYLKDSGKKTLRSLSTKQSDELENYKFKSLCNVQPFASNAMIMEILTNGPSLPNDDAHNICEDLITDYTGRVGVSPPIDKLRDMQASAYAIWQTKEE